MIHRLLESGRRLMALSIEEITAFVEVVERRSMSAAAAAMGVAPSIVTKRIQALEARVGTVLLARTTRRINLTDQGRLLYDEVRDVPRRLMEAEERVREQASAPQGRLRVIMPSWFASSGFHHEVIPSYLEAHPDVQLDLTISTDPIEQVGSRDFDLLVAGRFPHQRFPDTALVRKRILKFKGGLFAAPSYLAARGTPQHPRDLEGHNCLSYANRDREWHFVGPKAAPIVIRTQGSLTTNSNAMLYAATMRGLGISYSFPYFFDRELAEGRVAQVLEEFTRGSYFDVSIFYPGTRYLPRRTKDFIDVLAAHFGGART